MPVTALIIACMGPMCAYSAPQISFDSAAQCEQAAPMIAGISRAAMTGAFWQPGDRRERTAFQCIDQRTGAILINYDSAEQTASLPAFRPD